MKEDRNLHISHLIRGKLPKEGLRKLLWYTQDQDSGKYFYGTGNNSFSKEEMDRKVESGILFPLPKPVPLLPKKGLWQSSCGEIIYADLVEPHTDKEGKVLFINPEAALST